jgi:hypothetical protein
MSDLEIVRAMLQRQRIGFREEAFRPSKKRKQGGTWIIFDEGCANVFAYVGFSSTLVFDHDGNLTNVDVGEG